ncbi:unnamed protein product [Rhodiola kirilowii]
MGAYALRRPLLHKVLDYEDEFFALLADDSSHETHNLRTAGEELIVYNKEREARLQASLWGDDQRVLVDDVDFFDARSSSSLAVPVDTEASVRLRLLKRLKKFIGVCYPWLHAANEGTDFSFAYQLLYLLDATGFYSLGLLHALGIHVCRATGQELMDTSSRISKIRNNERERLRGPPWFKAVQRALLSATYIYAVFFFFLRWRNGWYQSAEQRMSAPTVYPPPPPPPPPKVAKEGIPLPPHLIEQFVLYALRSVQILQ